MPDKRNAPDAELEAFVRATCGTDYHPSGTAKMGSGSDAVVDAELREVVLLLQLEVARMRPSAWHVHPPAQDSPMMTPEGRIFFRRRRRRDHAKPEAAAEAAGSARAGWDLLCRGCPQRLGREVLERFRAKLLRVIRFVVRFGRPQVEGGPHSLYDLHTMLCSDRNYPPW